MPSIEQPYRLGSPKSLGEHKQNITIEKRWQVFNVTHMYRVKINCNKIILDIFLDFVNFIAWTMLMFNENEK